MRSRNRTAETSEEPKARRLRLFHARAYCVASARITTSFSKSIFNGTRIN